MPNITTEKCGKAKRKRSTIVMEEMYKEWLVRKKRVKTKAKESIVEKCGQESQNVRS